MSVKTLLGLEAFPITESEIIRKIEEAQRRHLSEIEFTSPRKRVLVKIGDVEPKGIMRDGGSYYLSG